MSRARGIGARGSTVGRPAPRFSLARNLHGNALRPSGTATVQQAPAPFFDAHGDCSISARQKVKAGLGDPEGSRTLSQPRGRRRASPVVGSSGLWFRFEQSISSFFTQAVRRRELRDNETGSMRERCLGAAAETRQQINGLDLTE